MGITIIVVAVPEGLQLALVLTQLTTLRQMQRHNVLVKDLLTCEQLGSVTSITTDKTCSVTAGRMTVARGWFFGNLYDTVPDLAKVAGSARRDLLARACALNSNASMTFPSEAVKVFRTSKPTSLTATGGPAAAAAAEAATIEAMGMCEPQGSATEVGLLHMLRMDLDMDFSSIRKAAGPFVHREPFTSSRGRSLTIYAPASPGSSTAPLKTHSEAGQATLAPAVLPGSGKFTVYAVGTPETVLASCAMFMTGEGALIPLEARRRESLNSVVELLAGRGLRPLAIAYRTLDPSAARRTHSMVGCTCLLSLRGEALESRGGSHCAECATGRAAQPAATAAASTWGRVARRSARGAGAATGAPRSMTSELDTVSPECELEMARMRSMKPASSLASRACSLARRAARRAATSASALPGCTGSARSCPILREGKTSLFYTRSCVT